MKKLLLILSVIFSLAAKGQKPDTIPATLLVSNIAKKQAGGVWLIRGYVVLGDTVKYLGKRKKPVPGWIYVWKYKIKPS